MFRTIYIVQLNQGYTKNKELLEIKQLRKMILFSFNKCAKPSELISNEQ